MTNKSSTTTIIVASLLMVLGIILGAFGTHVLKPRFNAYELSVYQTGIQYHFYNTLGLFIIAWLSVHRYSPWIVRARNAIIAGIFFFSGSLYLLSLTGMKWLGAVTPIGGAFLISGWIMLVIATLTQSNQPPQNK